MRHKIEEERKKHKKKKTGLSRSVKKRIKFILGESIFDNYLVAGDPQTIAAIQACSNIKQVNIILAKKYQSVTGKTLSLPAGRDHYAKYKDEQHPDFVIPE